MKTYKLFALLLLIFNVGLITSFAQKKSIHPIKPKDFNELELDGNYKILAEGAYSKVDAPFIFVARDSETYIKMQTLVEGLPEASKIDFTNSAVIAGFGGEKSTGGYSVNIRKTEGKYHVEVKSPGKDIMTTQVITTPFKVVQFPIKEEEGLPLNLSPDFSKKLQSFQITKNSFGFSGGFAGISNEFRATGTISILSFEDFVTMTFDLKGTIKEINRRLSETATGTLKDGEIRLARLDAGTFSDSPHPPFSVMGLLREKNLSLSFSPLPTFIADGYKGHGSLVAIMLP